MHPVIKRAEPYQGREMLEVTVDDSERLFIEANGHALFAAIYC